MRLSLVRSSATWTIPPLAKLPLRLAITFLTGFVLIAALVHTRVLEGTDQALMAAAKHVITPELDLAVGVISYLAAAEVSLVMMIALAFWLWRRGIQPNRAIAPLVFLFSVPIEMVLKYTLYQPVPGSNLYRRTIRYALFAFPSPMSFPSGHATRTAFMCVLAIYLLVRLLGPVRGALCAAPLVLLAITSGWSRIYLGYHWPMDVIGGFLLGIGGACLAIALLEPALTRKARSS
jgi:undecaprenyl-diphosphatase